MSKVLTPPKIPSSSSSSTQQHLPPQQQTLGHRQSSAVTRNNGMANGGGSVSPPPSPLRVEYDDDFTASSSILEFLSREQECCCSDADAESIFQEVSRLADNSDTRSVDEILREAELLIQQQNQLSNRSYSGGDIGYGGDAVVKKKSHSSRKDVIKHKNNNKNHNNNNNNNYRNNNVNQNSPTPFVSLPQQSIKLNAKYTKRIENVRQPPLAPLISSTTISSMPSPQSSSPPNVITAQCLNSPYGSAPLSPPPSPMRPTLVSAVATPTPTSSTSIVSMASRVSSATQTPNEFEAFIENLPSESVISDESTPKDMQRFTYNNNTSNNTIITTKATALNADVQDDDDDGTDTMEEITEGIETIELLANDSDFIYHNHHHDHLQHNSDNDCDVDYDDRDSAKKQTLGVEKSNVAVGVIGNINCASITIANNNNDTIMNEGDEDCNVARGAHAGLQQHESPSVTVTVVSRRRASVIDDGTQILATATSGTAAVMASSLSSLPSLMSCSSRNAVAGAATITSAVAAERRQVGSARRSSLTTPDSGIGGGGGGSSQQSLYTPRLNSPPVPALRGLQRTTPAASPISFGSPSASSQTSSVATAAALGSILVVAPKKTYCNKSTNSSPKHYISTLTSPVEPFGATASREHALKCDIEQLQERLKDTEERLQSLRIQHDSLSQLHRDLRENSVHLQEESEMLKFDVQHLNECANVLRTELQGARNDRLEAIELQKTLQADLDESRLDKKRVQEQREKDTKTIQDLQRQCREMERILMRKHPDSVSALIVASKNPGLHSSNNQNQDSINSRKLLEQRIAQLEADAKEQDHKAQQILANVQARFNSVQSKYETHIADLETQVLSLQEINTKLNEKIESQVRTLDYFVAKKADKYYNNCTQTDATTELQASTGNNNINSNGSSAKSTSGTTSLATQTTNAAMRDHATNTIGTSSNQQQQHSASSSTSSTANSTPSNSRPNSKQSGLRKPSVATSVGSGGGVGMLSTATLVSKLPISQSDSTISLHHGKEDAHLLATIRGMRVDLAIKDKAMQRLTRELDECKKTMRKLQREKDALRVEKSTHSSVYASSSTAAAARRHYNDGTATGAATAATIASVTTTTDSQALREAQNKIKLLEADYKTLHEKRIQDLKTLQTAHERELASCHETVRILQQRLSERDDVTMQKQRRKVPVDYYALKAKVTSLERRHTEREERLHMLVEALSKGRLNGALEDLIGDNNNRQ